MSKVTRICFVCLGNIVRSPLAENMFIHFAQKAGVEHKYVVDSAGTSAWHVGERPDSRMRRVAANHGFKYDGRSGQFNSSDFDRFDLIVAMDTINQRDLKRLARTPENQRKVVLMREYDPDGGKNSSVPDPYYGGIDGFEETFNIVKKSCAGLLAVLEDGSI